jgi:hypothetical protein
MIWRKASAAACALTLSALAFAGVTFGGPFGAAFGGGSAKPGRRLTRVHGHSRRRVHAPPVRWYCRRMWRRW